ncbi:MAG: glycosyl transferase family protein [Roseinatronobacter sp.]
MTLAPYIHTVGRGPGRARALTGDEAQDAMRQILSGHADPHAIGALLMLLRYRGETPEEIAGFTRAARAGLPELPHVDLDWPSYAAGRTRGLPWFLLAAKEVAASGKRVLIHGWNSHQADGADVRSALALVGIARAENVEDAARLLDRDGITYLPLETFAPRLLDLLRLRDVLGLRSCINTVCRMLNPAQANAAVQGVFHPPYLALQQAAGAILGQPYLCILKGGGGEFERNPSKPVTIWRLVDGQPTEALLDPIIPDAQRLSDVPATITDLTYPSDPFARAIITGTAQAARLSLSHPIPA